MIDAGLSEKELSARLLLIGRAPGDLHGVFLTHEHSDHVRGAGTLARKHKIPVFSTQGTYDKMKSAVGRLPDWYSFRREDAIRVAQNAGLRLAQEFPAGNYHYGLIFKKSQYEKPAEPDGIKTETA